MNKAILTFGLAFGLLCSPQVFAQNLDEAIAREIAKTEKILNYESAEQFKPSYPADEPYRYVLDNNLVTLQDLNGDKIKDAIVSLEYCEEANCHLTTHSFYLAIFQGLGSNQYRLLINKEIGLTGNVKVINGKIIVTSYDFKDSDPHCCPSLRKTTSYKIKDRVLTKI